MLCRIRYDLGLYFACRACAKLRDLARIRELIGIFNPHDSNSSFESAIGIEPAPVRFPSKAFGSCCCRRRSTGTHPSVGNVARAQRRTIRADPSGTTSGKIGKNTQRSNPIRVECSQLPGNKATPVIADEIKARPSGSVRKGDRIGSKLSYAV
jgi:hypothetical protein